MKRKILNNLRFASGFVIHILITFDVWFFCKFNKFHCIHYPNGFNCCYCDEKIYIDAVTTDEPINYAIPTKFIPRDKVN